MESDLQPENGAVQAEPIPSMLYLATATRANAGLAPSTMVSQATGVVPTGNFVDLTKDNDDNDDVVRVEDVPDDKDGDDTPHENNENQAKEPVIDEEYGCGMRMGKTTTWMCLMVRLKLNL